MTIVAGSLDRGRYLGRPPAVSAVVSAAGDGEKVSGLDAPDEPLLVTLLGGGRVAGKASTSAPSTGVDSNPLTGAFERTPVRVAVQLHERDSEAWEHGRPLAGARVELVLQKAPERCVATARSDSDGYAVFELAAGDFLAPKSMTPMVDSRVVLPGDVALKSGLRRVDYALPIG